MSKFGDYGLTVVIIDDEYHLFDLKTGEVYEAMSKAYLQELIELWSRNRYYLENYDIIKLII